MKSIESFVSKYSVRLGEPTEISDCTISTVPKKQIKLNIEFHKSAVEKSAFNHLYSWFKSVM